MIQDAALNHVTVVGTGAAALEVLREQGVDLALCDLGLPGVSGYDVARAVRAEAALRDIPLVALTGYGQRADRERTRQAGFDEHLLKPIELTALQSAMARLAAGRPSAP